ncbi:MAG: hypothetical protein ABIX37_05140 [Gammaproteobacteria bacterium]
MHSVNRRQFLPTSAALGAASSLAAIPAAAASGRTAFWWIKGPRYGVVVSEITPLFENLFASFHHFVKRALPTGARG